jgi:hypothetical protein
VPVNERQRIIDYGEKRANRPILLFFLSFLQMAYFGVLRIHLWVDFDAAKAGNLTGKTIGVPSLLGVGHFIAWAPREGPWRGKVFRHGGCPLALEWATAGRQSG